MAKNDKTTLNKKKKRKVRDPREHLTWKYWIIGALAVAAVTGVIILLSVLAARAERVSFSFSGDTLVRNSDGVQFRKAPDTYRVVPYTTKNQKPYGQAGDVSIYKVGYENDYGTYATLDENIFLTDKDGTLYYGNTFILPSLEAQTFDPDKVYIGLHEEGGMAFYFSSLDNKNTPDATDFVKEYLQGQIYSGDGVPQNVYQLQLTSSVYPYLSYMMHLMECDNGDVFVYTDEDLTPVKVSASLFEGKLMTDPSDSSDSSDTTDTTETTETPSTSEAPADGEAS